MSQTYERQLILQTELKGSLTQIDDLSVAIYKIEGNRADSLPIHLQTLDVSLSKENTLILKMENPE